MNNTLQQLQTLFKQRILILDGAMGMMTQSHAYMTESYLQERAERAGSLPLQAILDKVGDSEPIIEDEL